MERWWPWKVGMEMEIVIIEDGKACGIGALWKRSMGVREKWRKKEKIRMRKKDDWVGVRMKISVITDISVFQFYGYIEDISMDILKKKNINKPKID